MTPKEIHEDIVQTLAGGSSFYETVKKWAVEFKQSRDSTEGDPQSAHPKTSTPDEQVDAITVWFCMTDALLSSR